ncbi:MAG: permease prefix domain 1-containing protein [Vagococcus sp.]
MNTIKNYVETMFLHLPKTEELRQLKIDILANMEDKYLELIKKGSTENEAVGQVISEFGSIDEVLEELNLERKAERVDEYYDGEFEENQPKLPVLNEETVLDILAEKRSVAMKIGLGVILCALGVASLLVFHLFWLTFIGLIIMFMFLVLGVVFFIMGGFQNSKFEYLTHPFVLTREAREETAKLQQDFSKTFAFSITVGVVLCLVSVFPLLFTLYISTSGDGVLLAVALMLAIASFGVWLFIYAGVHNGTFTLLLTQGLSQQPTEEEAKKMKLVHKIDSIFWPLVTLVFFIWGFFLPGGFGVSWLIFPVGGILSQLWES